MKKSVLLLLALIPLTAAYARMVDHSMSPEESLQVPDNVGGAQKIPDAGLGFGNYAPNNQTGAKTGQFGGSDIQAYVRGQDPTGTNDKRFMDAFCNTPSPVTAQTSATMNCIENKKKESCAAFKTLVPEVQSLLDTYLSCISASTAEPDAASAGYGEAANAATARCDAYNTSRLALLKKYWRDQNTSYALVFLPDAVINPMALCVSR